MHSRPNSVKTVEVRFVCEGRSYRVKLRVGKATDPENHPGVVQLLFDDGLKREVIGGDEVVRHRIEDLIAEQPEIILELCQTSRTEEGNSGDCFCYRDEYRRWHCVCDSLR